MPSASPTTALDELWAAPASVLCRPASSLVVFLQYGVRYYVYVDNAGVVGSNAEEVTQSLKQICGTLDNMVLNAHVVQTPQVVAEALAVDLDGLRGRCRTPDPKYRRLDCCLRCLHLLPSDKPGPSRVASGICHFSAILHL